MQFNFRLFSISKFKKEISTEQYSSMYWELFTQQFAQSIWTACYLTKGSILFLARALLPPHTQREQENWRKKKKKNFAKSAALEILCLSVRFLFCPKSKKIISVWVFDSLCFKNNSCVSESLVQDRFNSHQF